MSSVRLGAVSTATVVGAGVFGASTARELARRGWDVTLVEQYTPGHVRSASGGDTRLIRFAHGEAEWYARRALRGLELWRELEEETGTRLFEPVGVAWLGTGDGIFLDESEATLRRLGVPCERLTPEEARRLYPSLGGDDLHSVLFEPGAGVLYARQATQALARGLRVETRRIEVARAAGRRRRRVGVRRMAARALPRARRAADLAPRRLLPRRRRRVGRAGRGSATTTRASTATATWAGSA